MNKLQNAEQLRKALQLFVRTLNDEYAMIVATVFPEWATNTAYKVDDIVSFGLNEVEDPQLYRCIIAHTSQDDWTPDVAVSLWVAIGLAPDNIPIWSQPTGAHDAYNTGDKVTHNGKTWVCVTDANVYEPGVYGWDEV